MFRRPHPLRTRPCWWWALAALALGCAKRDHEPRNGGSADSATTEISESDMIRLESLGYVDFTHDASDEGAAFTIRDPARSFPGYDLFTFPALGRADLLDPDGRVLRSWSGAPDNWERTSFAPNGDLLVIAVESESPRTGDDIDRSRRLLQRFSFDGELLWSRRHPVHHRVEERPDGRLCVLTSRRRVIEALSPVELIDNGLALLSTDGSVVEEERSLYDMLASRPDRFRFSMPPGTEESRAFRDFLHANYFSWMPGGELAARDPLYAASNVMVTVRMQDAVAVFDWTRGEVLWAWGPGELRGPHDAQVLENGNLLVFDNRSQRRAADGDGWSRVLEVDPLTREILWEYRADPPESFYSHSRGTVQRLENGNTLIGSSNQARAFEIDPAGSVVWEFRPPRGDDGARPVLRAWRYPTARVEAYLETVRD